MNTFLLQLHSILRWVIILFLLMNIFGLFAGKRNMGWSKLLLISAHLTLVIGIYQYYLKLQELLSLYGSFGAIMKNNVARFWAVEHISGMILAIILITIGHVSLKKSGNTRKTAILYTIALLVILAVVPWPFREGIGRHWF